MALDTFEDTDTAAVVLGRVGLKVDLIAESVLDQHLAAAAQSDRDQDFDPTTGMVIVLSMCSPVDIIKNNFNSMLNIHHSRDFLKSLVIIFIFSPQKLEQTH